MLEIKLETVLKCFRFIKSNLDDINIYKTGEYF